MSKRADKVRRCWRADEARLVVERWRSSGLSAAAFARQQGVSTHRLLYWSKQLPVGSSGRPVGFVAVPMPSSQAGSAAMIELEVGGVKVRVREELAPERIAQLCAALRAAERPC